jgi:hypothetical protein
LFKFNTIGVKMDGIGMFFKMMNTRELSGRKVKSMTFVFLGLRTRLLEVDQVERSSRLD